VCPSTSNYACDLTVQFKAEFEKIQDRVELIVERYEEFEHPVALAQVNENKEGDPGPQVPSMTDPNQILTNCMKAMQKYIQTIGKCFYRHGFRRLSISLYTHHSLERHGVSRDEIMSRIVREFSPPKKAEEDVENKEVEEVEVALNEADQVLVSVKEASDKAKAKIETLIVQVTNKFERLNSYKTIESPTVLTSPKSKFLPSSSKSSSNSPGSSHYSIQVDILDDLALTKLSLSNQDKELNVAQASFRSSADKINKLVKTESDTTAQELKEAQQQVKLLLAKNKEQNRNEVDNGLELHLEASRAARDAEVAKDNLTKILVKAKKLAKEVEGLSLELGDTKEKLIQEQDKTAKLTASIEEVSCFSTLCTL
jgi:hypothetical protein